MEVLNDWLITFGMIAIKPLPETFVIESKKAKGKFSTAIAWVAIVAVLIDIQTMLIKNYFSVSKILKSVLFMPIVVLFAVFSIHWLYQRLFGRKKDLYSELLYLIVGIFVPFVVISFLVNQIPIIGEALFWITLAYPLILTVIAVKTMTKLKIWQSVLIIFLGSVVAVIGYFVIPILLTSLMFFTPRVSISPI
jgi:hypothetical protein